jgi:DNA-binding LacI/PurR family transcriptional regulator
MSYKRNSKKKKPRVTIDDVANASGVSNATVSRVLSGTIFVKESTRERVMKQSNGWGTFQLAARSLSSGRPHYRTARAKSR